MGDRYHPRAKSVKSCPKCQQRFGDDRTFCFLDGTPLTELSDARLGTAIAGRYTLESVIGEGGMAIVYRARHKVMDQPFAIKVMSPLLARDPVVRERFRREAKSAKKIAHPNIIEIFEEGDTGDGTAYMVMEYLQGESLADIITRGPIDAKRAVALMIQMARGIARAHDLGVIHRDLKPENIFVCQRADATDLVKLLDFGIALSKQDSRLTGTGELFGTPQYMAPERITSTDTGPASDLYALGVIFFEMLSGRLPFDAPDVATFFVRHIKETPLPIRKLAPGTPEGLADLIDRLLAKDPKERPVDAHKVTAELVAVAEELGAPIPPEPAADPESQRFPSMPLSEGGTRRWMRRADVLREMLRRAYAGQAPPPALVQLLDRVTELARNVADLRSKSVVEQNKLEEIARRGRDGRQRLGYAVDALGLDTSRAREELRHTEEAIASARKNVEAARKQFLQVHKDITLWEGRCGFAEPYEDLMNAYRDAADVIEGWLSARGTERRAGSQVDEQRKAVGEMEFQLTQLRESLLTHEQDIEAEREATEGLVVQLTHETDEAEEELLSLAEAFCEPLRERAELDALFRQLEAA